MKNIQNIFIASGFIWGVIFGAITAFTIGGGVTGLFWVFIFGDNNWPQWAWMVIYAAMALSGLFVFVSCVLFSWRYAQKIIRDKENLKKEYCRGIFFMILGILIILGYLFWENRRAHIEIVQSEIRTEEHRKRIEDALAVRKTEENNIKYYCRIIRKKANKLTLIYHGSKIRIFQTLLHDGNSIFAVSGRYDLVKLLAGDAQILLDDNETELNFKALPEDLRCGETIYFIQSETYIPSSYFDDSKIIMYIPDANVRFPMYIWTQRLWTESP